MRKALMVVLLICITCFAVGCDKKSNQTEGTSDLAGVSMCTEKNQYTSDVRYINVVWKNNTDKELLFGEYFLIQKMVGQEWKAIGKGQAVFTTIGYGVSPHSEVKHSYDTRIYSDNLEEGTYRIITDFSELHSPGKNDTYKLSTTFTVK